MNRLPWMPLDVDDYRRDTTHLSTLEHGAYLLLIMDYWARGGRPIDDEERLARIAGIPLEQWPKVAEAIKPLFREGWRHKRIDNELERAADVSKKRSEASSKRWSKRKTKRNAIALPKGDANGMPLTPTKDSSFQDEFNRWWAVYPNKVGKPAAEKSFTAALRKGVDFDALLKGTGAYVRNKPPGRDWLNPATFLNQRRWEDEPAPVGGSGRPADSASWDQIGDEIANGRR